MRAGVEDGSGDEAVGEFVAEPRQVPGVARGHRCARLPPPCPTGPPPRPCSTLGSASPASSVSSAPVGENRTATRRADVFFPHFAPPPLTCVFVALIPLGIGFGLVLVEECGVQWGVVE